MISFAQLAPALGAIDIEGAGFGATRSRGYRAVGSLNEQ